jgi:hypothetical protein
MSYGGIIMVKFGVFITKLGPLDITSLLPIHSLLLQELIQILLN